MLQVDVTSKVRAYSPPWGLTRHLPAFLTLAILAGCTTTQYAARARETIGEPPTGTLTGKYTVVRCYFFEMLPCQQALDLADASYVAAAAFLHLPVEPPSRPLALDLLANKKELARINTELGGSLTAQHKGAVFHNTLSIFLQCESCLLSTSDTLGLSGSDRSSIAHEVLHLERDLREPNALDFELPWLQEGSATNFEEQFMRVRGEFGAAEDTPLYALRMHQAQKLLTQNKLPSVSDIVHDVDGTLDDLPVQERYAVWWLFYRFMSTGPHAAAFARYIAFADTSPLRRGFRTLNARFGDDFDLGTLDTEFHKYIAALKPHWKTYGRLDGLGPTWLQLGGVNRAAIHEGDAPAPHFEIHGKVAVFSPPGPWTPAPSWPSVVLPDAQGKPCASVDLSGPGEVTVSAWVNGKQTRLATGSVPDDAPGGDVAVSNFLPFRVELDGKTLRGTYGVAHVEAPLPSCVSGAWGLTANRRGLVAWRGVERKVLP